MIASCPKVAGTNPATAIPDFVPTGITMAMNTIVAPGFAAEERGASGTNDLEDGPASRHRVPICASGVE